MTTAKKIHRYTSEDIEVTYDATLCIHAAKCVRGLPVVFNTSKRPWVQPANAPADTVAEIVARCPTGALQFTRKDGGEAEAIPANNLIRVKRNGPLYVHGDIRISNAAGEIIFQGARAALCRCGASANKPFCDNAHKEIIFEDAGLLPTNNLQEVSVKNQQGPLTITPQTNDSYQIEGAFEIVSADEEPAFRGTSAYLCRCGGSANKPFCDNTHKHNNFQAP